MHNSWKLTESEQAFFRWVKAHPDAAAALALIVLQDVEGLFPDRLKSLIRRVRGSEAGRSLLETALGEEAAERVLQTLGKVLNGTHGGS